MTSKIHTVAKLFVPMLILAAPVRGEVGQVGYNPEPYPPNDPLYLPSEEYPFGQHWIQTTQVDRAWRLVGY